MNIIINATITTVGPLSIRMPVAEGGTANKYENFPIMVRGIDDDGNKLETGYLPATTLRGFLRRSIVLRDMRAAAEAGKHYKLGKAYTELIGQDAESELQAGEIDLIALKKMREGSPVVDLFGSGLGVRSRLKVSHFLPKVNVLPDFYTGVRKDLDDTETVLDLMDPSEAETFLGRSEANNRRASAATLTAGLKRKISAANRKGEPIEELRKQLTEAENLVAKYQTEMGTMQNSSRTIVQHAALPAGLDLKGRLVIEDAKPRDLDMIEYALNDLSLKPILGAQSARGCGEILGIFDVMKEGRIDKRIIIGGYEKTRTMEISSTSPADATA